MLKQRRVRENASRALQVDEAVQLFAFCLSDVKKAPLPAPTEPAAAAPASADGGPAQSDSFTSPASSSNAVLAQTASPSSQAAAAHQFAPEPDPQAALAAWSEAEMYMDRLGDCVGLPIPTAAGTLTNAGGRE